LSCSVFNYGTPEKLSLQHQNLPVILALIRRKLISMSDKVATISLSRNQAEFLQANLSLLATTTRQAMARPRLEPERHLALGSRALVLEKIEDAVRSAMLDAPNTARKNARCMEPVAHPRA
jgi:hypothetical protein